ncbi:UNKNOWN [Stylonychia lemnae]|uniref:Uncharacterized protein n=1 Tax=Stylonychia lemnae TaxID=5949 RepID=A0A077ZQA4_STYLE|nr:UNKNOWN [Stylonychia lemnae]|eukprot:CDW71575.1 UNKNOWN [Stylonychia lemnae]
MKKQQQDYVSYQIIKNETNFKQLQQLPQDDQYEEEEDYQDQEEMDQDEEDDQVSETVNNQNNNYQGQNNYANVNSQSNGFGNVQMNPNFQFPGAGQNRISNIPNMNSNNSTQQTQNSNIQNRMRPQSAKTNDDQMKFQYQQQQLAQQQQQNNPQWIGQQNYLSNDPNSQYPLQMQGNYNQGYPGPYVQGGFYQGIPQGGNVPGGMKKRPTTASRRGNIPLAFGAQKKSFGSKNPSTLDLEVSKLRPRIINQERERLYDDALKQKMAANYLKDENTRLKTKIHKLEVDLAQKERLVDDLLVQQDSFQVGGPISTTNKTQKVKLEGHLALNLKRKVRELQISLQQKVDEVELLKRNIKSTKTAEVEVELKVYADECVRLRHQLEEVIKSKDTFADPEELKIIENKFAQQDGLINQLRTENSELANAYSKKEDENRQLRDIFADMEKKTKKVIQNTKEASKLKKTIKSQDKDIKRLTAEVSAQKQLNEDYRNKIEEMIKKGPLQQNSVNNTYSSNLNKAGNAGANDPDAKRLRQDIQEKDQKISELNTVVQQLQQKLQEKMNDISKEQQEKNKFKQLYEQYQDRVVQLEAQLEDGDQKPYAARPKTAVPKTENSVKQSIKELDKSSDKSKDASRSNIITKDNKVKASMVSGGKMIARVDEKQAKEICLEVKLKLQSKGFFYHQIHEFFFKPYVKDQEVTVGQLTDIFETNGLTEKRSRLLARYIIEPKEGPQVVDSDETSTSQLEVVKVLSGMVGHFKIYNDSNQVKKNNEALTKLFQKCKGTLRDSLQLEDYEDDGTVPLSAFNEAFDNLDISIDKDLKDYLIFVIYQRSESLDKMNYPVLFDLIDGKIAAGQLSVGSNDGSRKRPESSSPEKLKARNKEKYSGNQQPSEGEKKSKNKAKANDEDEDDDYEEEFDKLLDKDDDEDSKKDKNLMQLNKKSDDDGDEDDEYNEDDPDFAKNNGDMEDEQEGEDEIDEEEMLDVAEKCFIRIAESIIKMGVSVRQAFSNFIIREEIEADDGQIEAIELLSPIGFLEGIKNLGVTDLEEIEIACLMRVLTKQELENAILLRELIVIMENFGIQDDENQDQVSIQNQNEHLATDAHGEQDIEQDSKQQLEMPSPDGDGGKKKKKKKNTSKGIDLAQLDEKSIKIMAKLMLALMELNVSLYEFFEGKIYEQAVKTKKKENKVEIINSKDFFDYLQRRGVRKSNNPHSNLNKFLQLDPNYTNLLMLKKIAKTLDEMAKNEDLMQGILAAAEDDMGGQDDNQYEQNEYEEDENQQNQERLVTIGEDKEEDKLYESRKTAADKKSAAGQGAVVAGSKMQKQAPKQQIEDDEYSDDQQNFEGQDENYNEDQYEEAEDDYAF